MYTIFCVSYTGSPNFYEFMGVILMSRTEDRLLQNFSLCPQYLNSFHLPPSVSPEPSWGEGIGVLTHWGLSGHSLALSTMTNCALTAKKSFSDQGPERVWSMRQALVLKSYFNIMTICQNNNSRMYPKDCNLPSHVLQPGLQYQN